MPVSTRSQRKRWPPSSGVDEAETVTLPPDLYWDYVRPYTPIEDRAIINKRTGSTRFYAGKRVLIDLNFLNEDRMMALEQYPKSGTLRESGIPHATGEPGTATFRMHLSLQDQWNEQGNAKYDETDPNGTLVLLRNARSAWDDHLSKILSPSARLHACLCMFQGDNDVELPLLFTGNGTLHEVVALHTSMNRMSLNQPIGPFGYGNVLRYWVDEYFDCEMENTQLMVTFSKTYQYKQIVVALVNAGADTTQFTVPLDNSLSRCSYRQPENGKSIIERMLICCESYKEDMLYNNRFYWLVGTLRARSKASPTLRFNKGDRVECKMSSDPDGWESGTLFSHWYLFYTYYVDLDDGSCAQVPTDTDEYIRALD